MNQPDGELTREERDTIARLPREAVPPPTLEDTLVRALAARGLLGRLMPAAGRYQRWGLAAAAAVMLFFGGYAIGLGGNEGPAPELPRFALLLYEGPEYRTAPVGQEGQRVREYTAWAAELGARGQLEAGEKLTDEANLLVGPDGVVSRPASAGGPQLAGFFVIRALDMGAAIEIARTSPHLRYKGSVVIRAIEPTSPRDSV